MRANIVVKSAILAALTILSSVPALAGDFRTKERLPKSALGGESGGGGQVRLGYYTVNEMFKILEQIKNGSSDPEDANVEHPIDKRILLISKENKTEEEEEILKYASFQTVKLDDGRILVKDAYVDYLDESFDLFETKTLDNPLLKSVAKTLIKKERIDYAFIVKHEKLFKYAFEKANPDLQFDLSVYKNLVFEISALSLDFLLMQHPSLIVVQKPACKDIDGKPAPSAVSKFERFTPICASASMLAQIPQRLVETELIGLWFHEIAHQHKIGEKGAELVQQYIIDEVMSGRMQLRLSAKTLRMRIDGTMEYAEEVKQFSENGLIELKYMLEDSRRDLTEMRTSIEKVLMFNERDVASRALKVLDNTVDKLSKATTREQQIILINELWAQTYDFSATVRNRYAKK